MRFNKWRRSVPSISPPTPPVSCPTTVLWRRWMSRWVVVRRNIWWNNRFVRKNSDKSKSVFDNYEDNARIVITLFSSAIYLDSKRERERVRETHANRSPSWNTSLHFIIIHCRTAWRNMKGWRRIETRLSPESMHQTALPRDNIYHRQYNAEVVGRLLFCSISAVTRIVTQQEFAFALSNEMKRTARMIEVTFKWDK